MNKVYLIAPLAAVLAFVGYYYTFSSQYHAKIEAAKVAAQQAIVDRKAQERADREKAIALAVEANAQRKAEREAKKAKEEAEKKDREQAIENRNKLLGEGNKLRGQADRLARDIDVLKDEITKVELNLASVKAERSFLAEYVKQAEKNAKDITATATKIENDDVKIKSALRQLASLVKQK